jgi:hypothetical protein
MGIEMYTEKSSLRTNRTCWFVAELCDGINHTPQAKSDDYNEWRDTLGTIYIPQLAVQLGLEKAKSLTPLPEEIDLEDIVRAIRFLEEAVLDPDGIRGSY